jgi:exodeoxyribonuclease VII large subunit
MEDLWAFNDINLAYAIADSHIPVISAVGHESDFTICDFVADLRAPTPSAAAELAVPDALTVRAELLHKLTLTQNHLASKLTQERRRLEVLSNSRVLQSREALLDEYKMKINLLYDKLDSNIERILSLKDKSFSVMAAKLNAISPLNTLSRGYAIVQNNNGDALSSICNLNTNDKISLLFADGKANATVTSIEHPKGD